MMRALAKLIGSAVKVYLDVTYEAIGERLFGNSFRVPGKRLWWQKALAGTFAALPLVAAAWGFIWWRNLEPS